jgi:hypothetical protein
MKLFRWLQILLAISFPLAAGATLVTSQTFTPTVTIDFSQFTGGNQYFGINGPVQVGPNGYDVQFTSVNDEGYLGNYDGWALGGNGQWTAAGRNGYAAVNSGSDGMTFTFAAPVSAVGGFMNYFSPPSGPVTIEAIGAGNVVLESYDLTSAAPITAPGDDGGAFRGIVRNTADIVAFRISGNYATIDNLAFVSAAAVPTASTWTLVLLATILAVAGFIALRS